MGQRHDDVCALLLWVLHSSPSFARHVWIRFKWRVLSFCRRYLKDEHKAKKGRELDGVTWTVGSMRATVSPIGTNDATEWNLMQAMLVLQEIPQQRNGSDCGVFACKYAEYIAKDKPLTFKQVCVHVFFFFFLKHHRLSPHWKHPPLFPAVSHASLPQVNDLGNSQSEAAIEEAPNNQWRDLQEGTSS